MEALIAVVVGVLTGGGVYLLLRRHTFAVVLGVAMLGYAVNLFLFASGRLTVGGAALVEMGIERIPDPLPQALVLTAIVIGFAMLAFLIVLAIKARALLGSDDTDAEARE
jgi:multicomponent K+:H+ antiporter subunit C